MADTIRKVDCFTALLPNKVGEGAKVLAALKEAGVNLVGLWGYPSKKAKQSILELMPENSTGFAKAARKAGLEVGKKYTAFLVTGEDRPGAMAEIFAKIAAAGVNIEASKAVSGGAGTYGAAIFVDAADVKKTAKALGI